MHRRNAGPFALLCLLAPLALAGCSPPRIEIHACSLAGRLAFRVERLDGTFSREWPRASSIWVSAEDGPVTAGSWQQQRGRAARAARWIADLANDGDARGAYARRPVRTVLLYGQRLPGWTISQPPRPLRIGETLEVNIGAGGYEGWDRFTYGHRLPPC